MAHFAKLDLNSVVTEVVVINNQTIENLPFPESEPVGIEFCKSLYGQDTIWKQTSYNSSFRKQYAGEGYTYLADSDVFVAPKPKKFPSWVLNENFDWTPPIPRPLDGVYIWDERNISWASVPQPYPSWKAEGTPLVWTPPVPKPIGDYIWDEATQSWVLFSQEISSENAP